MADINESGKTVRFPVKLQRAAKDWEAMTKSMRKLRKRMLQQYSAGWYKGSEEVTQPINFIDRGVQILGPFLVANNPKVMIDTKRNLKSMRPFARNMELAMEHLFKEIKFSKNTLRPAVINSFFTMGITKTGIVSKEEVEIMGYWHDVGQPYCDNIDFTDYIGDVAAKRREDMEFEGHKYRISKEFVCTSGYYKNYDNLKPVIPSYGEDTNPQSISKNNANSYQYSELRKSVELIDLWLPDEGTIITVPPEGQGDKIMRVVEWDGPEGGPFDVLGYRYFPESVIPIPPVFTWLDLNNVMNRLIRKIKNQAERSKNVIIYDRAAEQDMETIHETTDGGTAGVRNVDNVKEIGFGAINEQLYPFVQYLEQQYSITGGNLYTIGGRSTQADTLGQEQMLQANASKQLEDMVDQVHQFTKSIVEKFAWFMWTDPLIDIPVIKRVGEIEVETSFSNEEKEGDFLDYTFDIEPYSMSRMSPEMKYQRLIQLISAVVLPTAQIAASQGSTLNATELIREAARYLDVRNLEKWWITGAPQELAMNPYQPNGGMNPEQQGIDTRTRAGEEKMQTASNLNNTLQKQGQVENGQQGKTVQGM